MSPFGAPVHTLLRPGLPQTPGGNQVGSSFRLFLSWEVLRTQSPGSPFCIWDLGWVTSLDWASVPSSVK